MNKIKTNFSVTVYGELEKFNKVISKARCRIFYKYENRNGTYITDEFADKLLSTVSYAPVKGIYDNSDDDYTDHGAKSSLGRIYGIVPENPNLAWETHLDDDGIERTYACVDVLIFTGLYKEASEIVGKSQSMELYPDSIDGEWQIINGSRYFVFKEGCFLGLQVLGKDVEPCFEGASFFSLLQPIKQLLSDYNLFTEEKKQGGEEMHKLTFKLSDDDKFEAIWALLNTNYNEANNWTVDYGICAIYDDYAVVKNYENNTYERVYYKKDDSNDSLTLGERTQCFLVDVTKDEKIALDTLQKLNNSTFEKVDENYSAAVQKISENEQKINELNETISTLTVERDNANNSLSNVEESLRTAQSNYELLKAEKDDLAEFKADIIRKEKQDIISEYTTRLSEEIINKYSSSIDDYDAISLKKELAYELVQSNPAIFSNKELDNGYIPKDLPKSGIEQILMKYKNK